MAAERSSQLTPGRVAGLVAAVAFLAVAATIAVSALLARPSEADVGFLNDMIAHHENAVEMSVVVDDAGMPDPIPSFADEVVLFQQYEIGLMEAMLRGWDEPRRRPDDLAMGWMGEAVPITEMPGMAPEEAVDRLADAEGEEAAERWLALMTRHHLAGIDMAEAYLDEGGDEQVRELAAQMAEVQRDEIAEYAAARERLGLEVPDDLEEPLDLDAHGHDEAG